ncbi:MAG: TraB/GumN family protein [Lentisphaeria bacterium]|nr:TraB/GumN family protein [Lentisphaeria bacterium]
MKRAKHLLLPRLRLILGMLLAASAQGGEPGKRVHMFWMVEGVGGARVYLLGSLHFGTGDMYPLPPPIIAAYRASETVVFETDLAVVESPAAAMRMVALGTYPQGESLADHVDAETLAALKKTLEEMNLPESQFLRYRPWYAAMVLSVLGMQRAGLSPALGVDSRLHKRAVEDGKEIGWFESFEFQLKLFSGLEGKAGMALLRDSVEETGDIHDLAPRLVRLWQKGDSKGLVALVNEGFGSSPELKKKLLLDRNRAWVRKLRDYLHVGGKTFVVVGAGHLAGDGGVVQLLREGGLRVTRPLMPAGTAPK